jgi:DNA modification methylase
MPLPSKPQVRVLKRNASKLRLDDESVDLIVTSPPYFSMRRYQSAGQACPGQIGSEGSVDDFLDALWTVSAELHRVLKPGGSLFLNIMDKYNSAASNQNGLGASLQGGSHEANRIGRGSTVDDVPAKSLIGIPWRYALGMTEGRAGDPWVLRADIIWHKTNGMPDPTRDRVQRKHEYIFHFTKRGSYHANPTSVKRLHSVLSLPTRGLRVPSTLSHIKHPAPFPVGLPLLLIDGWSPQGGVVLDPFGGSGTTALAASVLGRSAITVDLSKDYCDLARWRVRDSEERAAAKRVAESLGLEIP